MRIIGTWSSPFTRKVRILVEERHIPCEFVVDSPLSPESRVPAHNPLGKVPVLVRDDGSILIESSRIAEWLDGATDGEGLIPSEKACRTAVFQYQAVADGVQEAAVLVRMESLRNDSERSRAWILRQQAKVDRGIAWLDHGLGSSTYCVGGRFSLADISMACCFGYLQFRFPEGRWNERFLNVSRACARLEQRTAFVATGFRN